MSAWALVAGLCLRAAAGEAAGEAAGKAEEPPRRCPPGHCRSSEIVFDCEGDSGISRFLLEPGGRPAVIEVPAGTVGFYATAVSPVSGVRLSLRSELGSSFGAYASGRVGVPDNFYYGTVLLNGTAPSALVLSVSLKAGAAGGKASDEAGMARLTLQFRYEAVRPCAAEQTPPAGCVVYQPLKAHAGLLAWSQWARGENDRLSLSQTWSERLGASGRAWVGLPERAILNWNLSSDESVSWRQWKDFWTTALGPASDAWQHVFCYLDADQDLRLARGELPRARGLFPYERGERGSDACPTSGIRDREECGRVAPAFCEGGLRSSGSWDFDPPGCFVSEGANGSECFVLFNAKAKPRPRSSLPEGLLRWKICRRDPGAGLAAAPPAWATAAVNASTSWQPVDGPPTAALPPAKEGETGSNHTRSVVDGPPTAALPPAKGEPGSNRTQLVDGPPMAALPPTNGEPGPNRTRPAHGLPNHTRPAHGRPAAGLLAARHGGAQAADLGGPPAPQAAEEASSRPEGRRSLRHLADALGLAAGVFCVLGILVSHLQRRTFAVEFRERLGLSGSGDYEPMLQGGPEKRRSSREVELPPPPLAPPDPPAPPGAAGGAGPGPAVGLRSPGQAGQVGQAVAVLEKPQGVDEDGLAERFRERVAAPPGPDVPPAQPAPPEPLGPRSPVEVRQASASPWVPHVVPPLPSLKGGQARRGPLPQQRPPMNDEPKDWEAMIA